MKNGTQVKPVHISKTVDRSVDVSVNPYKEALTQEVDGHLHEEPSLEMKKCDLTWSILSTVIDYTTTRDNGPYVEMNTSNLYNKLQEDEQLISGDSSDQWDERFEEVTCSLHYSHKFDDTNDVSTTYLGSYMAKDEPRIFPVDNHVPFDGRGMSKAYLSNGTPMKLFFDSGASRSYLSKRFYDSNPVLHDMPKFVTTCTGIRIGNGSIVPALFVIPILFMACGHTFEIFTIVAEIDDDMDLVFGFKNMVETEGMLNTRTGEYDFIGRSIPIFPQNDLDVPAGEKAYIKGKAPFCDKLSGMICAKFFSRDMVYTLRVKFQDNQGIVQFRNGSNETAQLRKDKAVGILDLRSIGYFKVGYQKMVNMAESSKNFKMYHYRQIKSEAKTENWSTSDQYMRITGRYGNEKIRKTQEREEQSELGRKSDPYPWLTEDDPRRHQTDEEILYEKIDLSNSALSRKERARLMKMLIKYRDAFSLRDEIGECPNLKADIKVIDDSPFFVRPFPISENDKPFMDDQMERLVSLGILSKNSTSHTSPVMLITRKLTKDKRPVVDFRLLNTRILRRNTSIPLMSDVLSILGNSECEVVSCVDIKDAYHSIRLTEMSKEYCGILPYFGSPIYRYEVLPMGIACAPQIWMDYITLILNELEDKKKYIAIMDDLLIHSTKADHWKLLEQLLKSMCKNGLRLSPKKCQLFKTNLIYMGNEFTITKRTMTITPLRSRTEAINKIPTPRTPKQYKSFCGVVNYLSLFCPDLQKLLKPIVELTRKGRPFIWGDAQEKAFREVKLRLKNPPVLHLPKADGRFILYSDTSIEGTGSSLWQIQEGKPKLIGYASKTLPEACSRYSVTELEMTGLSVNMNLWKNLLKHREFDAAVDHAAVAQIMKAKTEPATTRIMRLLDRLSAYSFNLYYVKGRDMILSDYLSRHRQKDLDPSELIPISFCCLKTYRSIIDDRIGEEIFCIKTRASAKASGETVGEVHGADKPLDPNYKPEHQSKSKLPSVTGKLSPEKVIRKPISQTPSRHTPKRLATPKSVRIQSEVVNDVAIPDSNSTPKRTPIMVHGGARPKTPMMVKTPLAPSTRTPLTPPNTHLQTPPYVPRKILSSTPPEISEKNMNIHDKIIKEAEEKISGFDKKMQELEEQNRKIFHPPPIEGIDIGGADGLEILDPEIRIPTEEDFVLPPPLESLLDKAKMAYKFLPKQGDIDRLIAKINKKVLRDTNLCVDLRDLKAAYLTSPHFRDIYLYLLQNRMPLGKGAAKRLDQNARNYLILDGLLFKILENGEGNLDTVLCIPTSKVHILLNAYHSSILGGHTGITKCYHTISQRFYCPNLAENLRAYITGCHVCQLFKKGKDLKRPYQKRINLNVPAMTKISMDIKQMPANKGYSHILGLLCEVTNYMVALPLMSTRTPHILDAFQRGYLAYFGPPTHIICDQDPAFTSSLMEAFVTQLNIKIVLVSPTNHQSLQAEHGIKSLSGLLVKHLSTVWSWHSVLPYSMLCYNGYSSPNLNGYSPHELVFGHKMTLSHELEIKVDTVVSGTFKDYYEKLKKNLQYMGERLQKFRSQRLDLLNKDREYQAFEVGQIVYMFQARGSVVETGSRKIRCNYIGPLVIFKAVGPNQFLLMSLDGLIYPHLIEQSRLKAGTIWTTKGNVNNLADLRKALSTGLSIGAN